MENEKLFLDKENLDKYIKYYEKNKNYLCAEKTLKPNLYNIISMKNKENFETLIYYFKFTENDIVEIKIPINDREKYKKIILEKDVEEKLKGCKFEELKKETKLSPYFLGEEIDETEKNVIKLRYNIIAIVEYYSKMINYFQTEVSKLDLDRLYDSYDKLEYKKLEKLLQKLAIFYTKNYYKYPLNEDKKNTVIMDILMEHYNIDQQMEELTKVLNIINDIAIFQMQKKEEKIREKEEKRSNMWNTVFALIGIGIGIIQIIQALK